MQYSLNTKARLVADQYTPITISPTATLGEGPGTPRLWPPHDYFDVPKTSLSMMNACVTKILGQLPLHWTMTNDNGYVCVNGYVCRLMYSVYRCGVGVGEGGGVE